MPASATSSATSAPAPARRFITWLSGHVPFLLVTLFGLYLLWPVPTGVMPLSADHTVHLTRAFLLNEQLAGGHLAGWDPTWFFGFPLGELYPVLGDLGVIALRVLSLGLLDWPRAYAGLFTLVFLTQGWALLRCGRALGWGPIPGLVAGLLVLADVGAYREGGWIYTVTYGVWPQALATALAYLAFAELALAQARPGAGDASVPSDTSPAPSDSPFAASAPVLTDTSPAPSASPSRHLARAALAAAGALLAHPMAADDARPRRPALPPDRRPAPRAPPRAPRPPRRHDPPPPPRARHRRRPRGLVAAADERPRAAGWPATAGCTPP
jgi:hypothetical protein